MDIFLVRHGEAAASWGQATNPGLSELGRRQASDAAAYLQQQDLPQNVQLYSSPLLRARETAEPLSEALRRPVTVSEVFREIPSPVPMAERQNWLREFMQQSWPEQGPELHAWRVAAVEALQSLTSTAVIFTHFLVINAVVGRVQGELRTLCFYPDNGSVTRLRQHAGSLQLVELGRELDTFVN